MSLLRARSIAYDGHMSWDGKLHPRWPPGTAGGKGGKFMPKHMAGTPQWIAAVNAQIAKKQAKAAPPARASAVAPPPPSSQDLSRREKRVMSIIENHMHLATTSTQMTHGRWSTARAKQHQQIIAAVLRRHAKVPKAHKAIMVGGLAGAGKTSTLTANGVGPDDYIPLNPDIMKEELAKRGMVPDVPGHPDLSPLERSNLIHEESRHLTEMLAQRAYRQGKNVMWDVSMNVSWATSGRVSDLRRNGYTHIEGVFVDVDVDTALKRASGRYAADQTAWAGGSGKGYGGRPVPPLFITQSRRGSSTVNLANFRQAQPSFDSWRIFDNRGAAPRLVRHS